MTWRSIWRWLTEPFPARRETLRVVVVTAKTGTVIRGVLYRLTADALILKQAAVADVQNNQVVWEGMDGDVVIPSENIDYWQDALEVALLGLKMEQV